MAIFYKGKEDCWGTKTKAITLKLSTYAVITVYDIQMNILKINS